MTRLRVRRLGSGWSFVPAAAAAAALLMGATGRTPSQQGQGDSIRFNHRVHVENAGLSCSECHKFYESRNTSGRPTLDFCVGCHASALTDNPEEEKIRQAASQGRELTWNRHYRVPNHVYYSHARHVAAGKVECERCHGPIGMTTSPPQEPLHRLTMEDCIACHEENLATTDCIACHK